MKYCNRCGQQIDDAAVVCPYCGVQQQNMQNDSGSFGWGVLGFCFPLIGLILYLVWKDTKPRSSKIAGKGALISVIISVVFSVLSALLGLAVGFAGM